MTKKYFVQETNTLEPKEGHRHSLRMDQQEQYIGPDVMEVPNSPNNTGMDVDIQASLNNMEVEVNVDNLAAPEQDAEPWTLATLLASPAVVDWMGREVDGQHSGYGSINLDP